MGTLTSKTRLVAKDEECLVELVEEHPRRSTPVLLIAFRPRYAAQSNMVSAMNGSELVVYLGIPQEISKPNPLAEPSEL
ncbi:unnamed protein product [Heligmosomoides polygyrus]|uniref:Uncharacterized protein n=1 Tax=Heligmosomoides polygyrus TaxID=6339 RepID=A0A183GLZ8_HELPZ|nr:unnamed protein product [Heligmosomoides polygyrus]